MAKSAEVQCREILELAGWRVRYAGFLDFVCDRGDDLIFVEVKSHKRVNERRDQHELMLKLAGHGVPCYVYRPDTGFLTVPGNARSDDLEGIRAGTGRV